MKSEVKEKGKKTEEGRLLIKEIRKGEFAVSTLSVIKVVMAVCSVVFTAEGIYLLAKFIEGYTSKYGTGFDIIVGIAPFILAIASYFGTKGIENNKQDYQAQVAELENDVLKM